MSNSIDYTNYQRYLASKKSVDDRALNYHVWARLGDMLGDTTDAPRDGGRQLRVLELGSGIGTMLERLLEQKMLPPCEYVAVDELGANQVTAAERLAGWGTESHGVTVVLETAELFDYLGEAGKKISSGEEKPFDLVIAHAFLDLVDAAAALAQIKAVMHSNGLLFTSINFDGATILQPEIDPDFDAQVEALYHQTMDERLINGKRSGESKTGRHLFGHLTQAGFEIREAGASDWVVFAAAEVKDGRKVYVEDEAYFLHFIVETMHGALKAEHGLDQKEFEAWVEQRHRQIEAGELVYIAHQLDFLAVL